MKSDSSNAVNYVPGSFNFLSSEIRDLCSTSLVEFCHVSRPANSMEDALAKKGVERSTRREGVVM